MRCNLDSTLPFAGSSCNGSPAELGMKLKCLEGNICVLHRCNIRFSGRYSPGVRVWCLQIGDCWFFHSWLFQSVYWLWSSSITVTSVNESVGFEMKIFRAYVNLIAKILLFTSLTRWNNESVGFSVTFFRHNSRVEMFGRWYSSLADMTSSGYDHLSLLLFNGPWKWYGFDRHLFLLLLTQPLIILVLDRLWNFQNNVGRQYKQYRQYKNVLHRTGKEVEIFEGSILELELPRLLFVL